MRDYSTPRNSFAQSDFGDSFITLEFGHSFSTPGQAGEAPDDFRDADFRFAAPDFAYEFTAPEHTSAAPSGGFKDAVDYERSFVSPNQGSPGWGATAWRNLPTGDASNMLSTVRYVPTGMADAAIAVAPKARASIAIAQAQGTYKGAIVFDFGFEHAGGDGLGDGTLHGTYGSSNTAPQASAPAPFETLSLAQMLTQILLNGDATTAATYKPIEWPAFAQALTLFSSHAVQATPN